MLTDRPLFRDIVAAIADGATVDWTAAEMGTSDPDHRRVLAELRVLAQVRAFGRASDPEDDGAAKANEPGDPERWGHLQVLAPIGRGATGAVYRAFDAQLARQVALKLVAESEPASSRAIDEGALLARVRHPNVVTVHGAARHDGWAGLWMELVDGHTLEDLLQDGPLSIREAVLIGIDVCNALAAVHGAGLVHRDIKAQNVMREAGGRTVLMDFGAGRDQQQHAPGSDLTGTPLYMAPELFRGHPAARHSDIYSVGVLLYRLTTGAFPVEAASLDEMRVAHAAHRVIGLEERLPDVPPLFAAAVTRALSPEPPARFDSTSAMESALWQVLRRQVDARVHDVSAPQRRPRPLMRAIAAAAAAAVLAAGGWALRPRVAPGPSRPFFLTASGWTLVVRDGALSILGVNPHEAWPLAVLDAGAALHIAGGARARLNDTGAAPLDTLPPIGQGTCCWFDGASDGAHNFSVQRDIYTGEPATVYRFTRGWTSPERLFELPAERAWSGIAWDAEQRVLWISSADLERGRIERFTLDGRSLGGFDASPRMAALGFNAADGTLWAVAETAALDTLRLVQHARDGRQLATVDIAKPDPTIEPKGGEFP